MSDSAADPHYVPHDSQRAIPSAEEAEARLHKEGYESFSWYDVPETQYPDHQHSHDECLWVLKGEMTFTIAGKQYRLLPGDRLYLPQGTHHTATVPKSQGVTYIVGQKRKRRP